MRTATRRARGEIDQLIRQTLGDQRYAVFKQYEATLPQRTAVGQLAQRLSYSDSPLAPSQAEALVDMLVLNDSGLQPALPGVSVVVDPDERQAVPVMNGMAETVRITEDVLSKAREILSPRQVAALEQLQREQQAARMVMELVRDSIPPGEMPNTRLDMLGIDIQLLLQ